VLSKDEYFCKDLLPFKASTEHLLKNINRVNYTSVNDGLLSVTIVYPNPLVMWDIFFC